MKDFKKKIIFKNILIIILLVALVGACVAADKIGMSNVLIPLCIILVLFLLVLFLGDFNAIRTLRKYKNQLALRSFDAQLNIYSRQQFIQEMKKILQKNANKDYYLILTNICQMKLFNEYFGYEAGNELIKKVADALSSYSKDAGIAGRFRDDYLLMLIEKDSFSVESFKAEILENEDIIGHFNYRVELTCGVYEIVDKRISSSVMLDRALISCENAQSTNGSIVFYKESMLADKKVEKETLDDIIVALDSHQFVPYLQPQFDKEGNLTGCEVLARWQHPQKGLVLPGEFIGICEEQGLIAQLDREIWEEACKLICKWDSENLKPCSLSVNVSPIDFLELDILKEFTSLSEKYRLDNSRLKIEITETSLMKNSKYAISVVESLRKAGFAVAIDDFGNGYSSLGLLSDIDVDFIKLDLSFTRRLDHSQNIISILSSISAMVVLLGINAIVEGVETEEQLNKLVSMGYKYFQGMYFSAPISAEDLAEKYLK